MTHAIRTARNVARSLSKLYAGVPGENHSALRRLRNVVQALKFLLSQKLGVASKATLILGHAGRSHTWPLLERSDLSVLEEIFLDREYALDIPPPAVVFDLGANFGAASVFFAQKWPEARIYSVEPSPAVFRRLLETTAGYPGISCINYAVGSKDGTAEFVVAQSHISSSLFRDDPHGERIVVQTRTLATLMAETGVGHVDVLKFDVEGAEEDLFSDQTALRNVGTLVGEVHRDLMRMPVDRFVKLFDGYDLEKRSESADLFVMTAVRRAE